MSSALIYIFRVENCRTSASRNYRFGEDDFPYRMDAIRLHVWITGIALRKPVFSPTRYARMLKGFFKSVIFGMLLGTSLYFKTGGAMR